MTPEEVATRIVGLPEGEAEQLAGEHACGWRVGGRDGEFFPVTMDYRPDRITVIVDAGIVSSANTG